MLRGKLCFKRLLLFYYFISLIFFSFTILSHSSSSLLLFYLPFFSYLLRSFRFLLLPSFSFFLLNLIRLSLCLFYTTFSSLPFSPLSTSILIHFYSSFFYLLLLLSYHFIFPFFLPSAVIILVFNTSKGFPTIDPKAPARDPAANFRRKGESAFTPKEEKKMKKRVYV